LKLTFERKVKKAKIHFDFRRKVSERFCYNAFVAKNQIILKNKKSWVMYFDFRCFQMSIISIFEHFTFQVLTFLLYIRKKHTNNDHLSLGQKFLLHTYAHTFSLLHKITISFTLYTHYLSVKNTLTHFFFIELGP